MRILARSKFFDANPVFGIYSPDRDFLYGRNPEVEGSTIGFFDQRSRGITVRRVGESSPDRLVVWDTSGRRIEFVPISAEWFNRVMVFNGNPPAKDDEDARRRVAAEPFDW